MAEQVRLGFVGCGGIAGAHLEGYKRPIAAGYDRFAITAVCDVNGKPQGLAARVEEITGGCPWSSTADEMAEAGAADAADICLPHAYHHTAAVACQCGHSRHGREARRHHREGHASYHGGG